MTLEYPIMTFSGLSFSNIFSVPKSNISDNDKYMRKLSGFVVLNFRMKKYPINYPILSRTSCTVHGVPMKKQWWQYRRATLDSQFIASAITLHSTSTCGAFAPTAMAAPASVVDVDDTEDELPLKALRTVVGAQKIVDEKRKEEEALAAEPSLGFNDE